MPSEYNVESMPMVKRLYGFDVLADSSDSGRYVDHLELFMHVRPNDPDMKTKRKTKGVLRIDL